MSSTPQPYLSSSKTFVWLSRPYHRDNLLDLTQEELEIARLSKQIEPEYLNKKIDAPMAEAHLKTAISESQQEMRALKRPLEALETVASQLAECGDCNELEDQMDSLARQVIEDMQLIDYRKKVLEDIRENVHQHAKNSDQAINVHKELCQKMSTELTHWDSLSLRQKFGHQKHYKDFRLRIWEASGETDVMPNARQYLPAENGEEDDESSGDELEIAGGSQNYKCPLCLGFLQTPLVSQLCKHTFCQMCFQGHLEQCNTPTVPCPNAGCSKRLSRATVLVDERLAARVRQFRRREEQRNADDEFEDAAQGSQSLSQAGQEHRKISMRARGKSESQKKKRVVVDDDDD